MAWEEAEEDNDDVFEAWGAMDDDEGGGGGGGDAFFDAQVSPRPSTSTFSAATTPAATAAPFDDGGEPDFAGWLAAQSKSRTKKPLPKGLSGGSSGSKTTTTTTATATRSVGSATSKTTQSKAASQPPKKILDTKPKEEAEEVDDDGWGDAWD